MNALSEMRITIVAAEKRRLDDVVGFTKEIAGQAKITAIEGGLQAISILSGQLAPDILLVDLGADGNRNLENLERLVQQNRGTTFIVLCDDPSTDFLMKAMRLGIREVLPLPLSLDALRSALLRTQHPIGFIPVNEAKILAFVSCKGGSGSTFLSTNLAYALAEQGQKVALFDCNLQFGDALLFLTDAKPVSTLSDVALNIHRLDPGFLTSSMVNVAPNLSVLAAPEDPAQAMEITPEHIDALLKLARSEYDFIIVDVSRTLDAQTIKVLDHADKIFGVLQLTLPYIRDSKRMLDIFDKLDYPKSKVHLIVNRYDKGGDISLSDLEKSCGKAANKTIPNNYTEVASSVNQGIPIVKLAPSSPVAKALTEWSSTLANLPVQRPEASWFNRMFKRVPLPEK